jgi:hypothetical protein
MTALPQSASAGAALAEAALPSTVDSGLGLASIVDLVVGLPSTVDSDLGLASIVDLADGSKVGAAGGSIAKQDAAHPRMVIG